MKWNEVLDSNYINSELLGEVGTEKVVTIKSIDRDAEFFCQQKQRKEKGLAINFEECKPLIANVTNTKTLMRLFGGANEDISKCYGRKIILYVSTTKVAGKERNCIRIKEYSETKCSDCKKVILPAAGKSVAELIEISNRNCGRALCLACMKKIKAEENKE